MKDGERRMHMDLLSYMLPFVSFMIDAAAKRVYMVKAKLGYQFVKVMITFYFLFIYIIALNRKSKSAIFWIANVNLFVYPIIISIYWWLLINAKLS